MRSSATVELALKSRQHYFVHLVICCNKDTSGKHLDIWIISKFILRMPESKLRSIYVKMKELACIRKQGTLKSLVAVPLAN